MTRRDDRDKPKRRGRIVFSWVFILLLAALSSPEPIQSQTRVPNGQIHLSVTLGGYFLIGVGYTHWIEEHHALEFTAFPFAHPGEGFPFGLRAGYAWVPSDEVWRAKLGGNMTVIIRPGDTGGDRFSPLLALTPGIEYFPESKRSLRADFWVSYYLRQKVFAPTGIEFLYAWPK